MKFLGISINSVNVPTEEGLKKWSDHKLAERLELDVVRMEDVEKTIVLIRKEQGRRLDAEHQRLPKI